jgi:hypothetical protein
MSRLWLCAVVLAGCIHPLTDDASTSSDSAAVEIDLGGAPNGVDCINFSFADEDGVTTNVQRALVTPTLVIRNLAAGAYSLSAQAYGSGLPDPVTDGDCTSVPLNSPWATEQPVTVVLEPNERTNTQIDLVQTGRAGVTPVFVETPRVMAQNQGPLGFIASGAGQVVWVVNGNATSSAIVEVADVKDAIPTILAAGQSAPSEIVLDPATGNVFWTNRDTGVRDSDGNLINDGSVWEFTAGAAAPIVEGFQPSDLELLGDGSAVWGDLSDNAINCSSCTAPLAVLQVAPNAVGAHGSRVYWDNGNTNDVLALNLGDAAPTLLLNTNPRTPIGFTADDTNVYWTDIINATGLGGVWQAFADGTGAALLLDNVNPGFPIGVLDGFIYWSDGGRIARIPVGGGASEDVIVGPNGGFALDHDGAGHGVMYWTDNTHGGLVWRGRVD